MMDNMYTGYKNNINRPAVREQIRSNFKKEDKINNIHTKYMDDREKIEKYYANSRDNKATIIYLCGAIVSIAEIIIFVCLSDGKVAGFFYGCFIGIFIMVIFWRVKCNMERSCVGKEKMEVDELEECFKYEKEKAEREIEEKIREQIELYDENVKNTCNSLVSNPLKIESMIEYSLGMFKRMISHADSDSNKKFIECNFTYIVTTTEIKYLYDSEYTNPRDDFNFAKQRFRNLNKLYECEGLALALAEIMLNEMKKIYSPDTLNITIGNVDSKVTMEFKAPNENFVAAKDIL